MKRKERESDFFFALYCQVEKKIGCDFFNLFFPIKIYLGNIIS